MTARTKKPKANWTTIQSPGFRAQRQRLRPEHSMAGGIKWRSIPQEVLMSVYRPIAEMFKLAHPYCRICELKGNVPPRYTDSVHHSRGRAGLLLLDIRFFVAACMTCHNWATDNPDKARALGVTCAKGEWNRQPT
jgi:hypothetical protein